jgi:hypothetical protein
MTNIEEPSASGPYEKDDGAWRIGAQDDVSWIQQGLTPGTAITTAIPPEFKAFATIALCKGEPPTVPIPPAPTRDGVAAFVRDGRRAGDRIGHDLIVWLLGPDDAGSRSV